MAESWDVMLRWEKLAGGKNSQPFEEEDDNEDKKNKKVWIDSNNVYPKVKEKVNNARN